MSYKYIGKAAAFAEKTVKNHMKALRELGAVNWSRRTRKTENGCDETTANSYFIEISHMPPELQTFLREELAKRGIVQKEHPDRKGSSPVPNRAQRLAERVAKGFRSATDRLGKERRQKALIDNAAFLREEMALFGDVPVEQWAQLRHPDDPAAQRAYNARIGIDPFFDAPCVDMGFDSPPKN